SGCLKRRREKALHNSPNAFWLGIRHLQINLSEFRLPVRTQIFIPKTASDLEITLTSRDHQNLFKELRGLRQSIESSRLHATRYEIVTLSLRCGPRHERSFNFHETA